ncbi:phosphotransferase family enzyme [Yoonia maritima]|uniref:Phosphotransferase family enzyme n=1 Tax=Yoonia maritima TaxID=1435347 RepID=A0A2T0VTP4_9RHOB|nr:aminoglycoside phosphotransferase family protein [Yoonia maritima]PRY74638.1 phosphotransferase family enzyme [Yoonia maritima]
MKQIASGKRGRVYDLGDGQIAKYYVPDAPDTALEREVLAARLAHDHGVPTPKVLSVDRDIAQGRVVFEYVSGVAVSWYVLKRPWRLFWASREMARCLANLHTIPDTQTPNLKTEMCKEIDSLSCLTSDTKKEILDQINQFSGPERLCHFDYHSSNVMVSDGACVVIDWGAARSGPPLADLTQTCVINRVDSFPDGTGALMRLVIRALRWLHIELLIAFYSHYSQDHSYASVRRGIRAWQRPIAAARLADDIAYERTALLRLVNSRTSSL